MTVKISNELAEEACRKGLAVEVYVEKVLARGGRTQKKTDCESVSKALDRIAALRKGNRLHGVKIKDLIR